MTIVLLRIFWTGMKNWPFSPVHHILPRHMIIIPCLANSLSAGRSVQNGKRQNEAQTVRKASNQLNGNATAFVPSGNIANGGNHMISYRNVAAGLVSTPSTGDLPEAPRLPQVSFFVFCVYFTISYLMLEFDVDHCWLILYRHVYQMYFSLFHFLLLEFDVQ